MESNILARAEALLFTSGEGLSMEELQNYLQLGPARVSDILERLAVKYARDEDSALMLCRVEDRYILTIKAELRPEMAILYNAKQASKLSSASYEVMAAVLYNQPVTRAQVEAVRGVNSDGIITRLLDSGLLEECGVLEQPGRPSVFRVSEKFMLEMGLSSTKDLAPMELLMYENIRQLEEGEE